METIKKVKVKKEKVEYFTDEMARDIYPFQPPMITKKGGGKPIMKTISIRPSGKNR